MQSKEGIQMASDLKVQKLIVHHSFSPDSNKVNDWASIAHFHTSWRYKGSIITEERAEELMAKKVKVERPWRAIGYHAGQEYEGGRLVRRVGRPETMAGAHTAEDNMNKLSLGYCFVGKYDEKPPTDEELRFGAEWFAEKILQYGLPGVEAIEPHRKYATYKTCPGRAFPIDKLKKFTADILEAKEAKEAKEAQARKGGGDE
jgi:hypothetical protein